MALQIDYLQALIERNDVYDPATPALGKRPTARIVAIPARRRSRFLGITALRLLTASGLVSWSIVALETWLLVG